MKSLKLCRNIFLRPLVVLVIISSLSVPFAYCQDTEDSQIFIAGFNAYQQKDYATSISDMNEVLQKYPETPLRDMVLFWLSQSYYKAGNQQEAARCFSQFSKEYPENPLKSTVEDNLLALTARYEKGETLPGGPLPVKQPETKVAEKVVTDAERSIAAEKKERERIAQTEAELTRMNALKSESERSAAADKVEHDRISREKIAEVKRAVAAEAARMASRKAEEERQTAEQAVIAQKAEESRLAQQRRADEKINAAKLVFRAKAISQYKSVIEKYPSSAAAASAAAKLRELGVAVAVPAQVIETPLPENAQVLRLEVAQFAGFEFNILPHPATLAVGRHCAVPFEIINRGNGKDSFSLASAFPAEYSTRFAAAGSPDVPISRTPELAPDEAFKGVIDLVIPPASIDGMRASYPVKAASLFMADASQSREVPFVVSAPLLRAVLRTEKATPLPGDRVVYHVSVLNVGSTSAQDVTFRFNFPPQLEPAESATDGFRQETKSTLVIDKLTVKSGESRDYTVAFRLKDGSLAEQELLTRAELINTQLSTTASFVSNMVRVGILRSVSVRASSDRLVAVPGQVITVPFVVTNTGNIREKFNMTSIVSGIKDALIFNDLNQDGIRQANEPVIGEIGPLAPREEANVAIEIKTPATATDNSQATVQLLFVSGGDSAYSASGSTQLAYSRPVLNMSMSGTEGRLKPGTIASFDLTVTNSGSNIARIVELQSAWPEQLELVTSDPASTSINNGAVVWRFKELGAGEKRNIKVTFKVKPGTSVGTAIRVKNILTYEDQVGNRY